MIGALRLGRRQVLHLLLAAPILAACGGRRAEQEPGAAGRPACPSGLLAAQAGPVEITFWHSMTAAAEETLTRLVNQFNAAQERVRVRAVFQGSYADLRNKYLTALRGGELPDLAQIEDTATQVLIDSGSVVAAQDCIDAEHYSLADHIERVVAYWTVRGKLWPMPFNVSAPVLYYNKTAFRRAGLDPDRPPATLEEVREASQRIVAAGAARHGMAFDLSFAYLEHWFGMAGEPFVDQNNGRDGRATRVLFNNDLGRRCFTWLKQMIDEGLAVNVGRNTSGIDDLLAVATGDAAITVGTSASLRAVLSTLESGQFPDITPGVGPMPGPRGPGGVLVGGAALWIVARSAPEKQEAARVFARWLNEPEQQAAWHAGSGYIPLRKSAVQLPAVQALWTQQPAFRVAYDQLLAGRSDAASAGPVLGAYAEVREAVIRAEERMWLQGVAPEVALREAEQQANQAIQDYNRRVRP